MQLHTLKRKHPLNSKKRIGRGGKRGKTSGRGQKGQSSRAGHRIKPGESKLLQRIPKLRGSSSQHLVSKNQIINLRDLVKLDDVLVTPETLKKARLIRRVDEYIKILSTGEAKRAYQVEGVLVSAEAKDKIEKGGGQVK